MRFWRRERNAEVRVAARGPDYPCVHVTFGDRLPVHARGALLDLPGLDALVTACGLGEGADWVLHSVDAIPVNDRRAAAFVIELANRCDATLWLLEGPTRRFERIVGHLRGSGAVVVRSPEAEVSTSRLSAIRAAFRGRSR